MWVGTEFPGDNNETLKRVQFDVYGEALGLLFRYARDRYVKAATLLSATTESLQLVRQKDGFDHRVLQTAHDRIAAQFRYRHDDGGQLRLFSTAEEYKTQLRENWLGYFSDEAQSLAGNDEIDIAILEAVAYANSERGMAAERRLMDLLNERFGSMPSSRTQHAASAAS